MRSLTRASSGSQARHPLLPVLIGWQGIQIWVPQDWYLKGYTGDWREGYLQIGSRGETELDLKWVRSRRRTDLQFVLQQFLKRIERTKRKARPRFTGTIHPLDEHTIEFRWSADERAVGQIRRYPSCHTIVLVQVRTASEHKALHTLAKTIFDHLQVEPELDGWVVWSLYGLRTAVPERFRLVRAQLLTGQTRLFFRHRREHLLIERIARAQQLLKGYSLEEWAQLWLKWERYRGQVVWDEARHALRLHARLPFGSALAEGIRSVAQLHLPAWRIEAITTLNPEHNTLFHIQYQTPRANTLLEEVFARTVCP